MNYFIHYQSELNKFTEFSLFIPYKDTVGPLTTKKLSISSENIIEISKKEKHICNTAFFAEDNPNILNKYEKLMFKYKIPYMSFLNGLTCFN